MTNRRLARWEPHEIDRLRELAASGKTDCQIASALRRTKLGVRTKRRAIKVLPGWKSMTVTPTVRRMLGKLSDQAVAKELRCSDSSVLRLRKKLNISAATERERAWSESEVAMLGKMPDGQLAKKLGVSRKHVFEIRKRRKVKAFKRQ